jgi:hypothetical protein
MKEKELPWCILENVASNKERFIDMLIDEKDKDLKEYIRVPSEMLSRQMQILCSCMGYDCFRMYNSETKMWVTMLDRQKTRNEECMYDIVVEKQHTTSLMFDLEVEKVHEFYGGGFINHNCQGMSIDKAIVSTKNIFAPGQAYVALSRIRSLEGLSLEDFNTNCIRTHPKVIYYYKNGYVPKKLIYPSLPQGEIPKNNSKSSSLPSKTTSPPNKKRKREDNLKGKNQNRKNSDSDSVTITPIPRKTNIKLF